MIRVFEEQKVVTACMFTCLVLSIILKLSLGMFYRHMIKEADNMAITNNKLLKQCKMKFSNCFELNNGIHNIPVFVDKFINRLALGPFSFDLLYHLSGQMMLLSVVSAGVGICRSILAGRTLGAILPFYIVSFLGLYLYFSVSTVVDIKGKRRMLKINLVDYLENHLASRMNVTRRDIEMLYGDAAFQEKPGGIEDQGGDRSSRKKSRKTVELMPVGGRSVSGNESKTSVIAAQRVSAGISDAHREEETALQDARETGSRVSSEVSQEADQEARRMTQGAREASQHTTVGSSREAAVTEEELEMLLKEFLTG